MISVANRKLSQLARYALVLVPIHLLACNLGPRFPVVGSAEFALEDKQGTSRGAIRADETGSWLVLRDGSGRARVQLFATDELAGIAVQDRSGKTRIALLTSDIMTYAALYDDKGNVASILGSVRDVGSEPVSKEKIESDAKQLLEKLKSGRLEGLRELDQQAR